MNEERICECELSEAAGKCRNVAEYVARVQTAVDDEWVAECCVGCIGHIVLSMLDQNQTVTVDRMEPIEGAKEE